MKTKVKLSIFLFFGLVLWYMYFRFVFCRGAKLESGVTVTAPSTTETEKICDDTKTMITMERLMQLTKTVLLHPQVQRQEHVECKYIWCSNKLWTT